MNILLHIASAKHVFACPAIATFDYHSKTGATGFWEQFSASRTSSGFLLLPRSFEDENPGSPLGLSDLAIGVRGASKSPHESEASIRTWPPAADRDQTCDLAVLSAAGHR